MASTTTAGGSNIPTPEPSSMLLLGPALLGLKAARRRMMKGRGDSKKLGAEIAVGTA
jgi:hypothetical protein